MTPDQIRYEIRQMDSLGQLRLLKKFRERRALCDFLGRSYDVPLASFAEGLLRGDRMKKYMAIGIIGCLLLVTLGCIEEISNTPAKTTQRPPTTKIVWRQKSQVMMDETKALSAGRYTYWEIPASWSSQKNARYEITFQEVSGSDANFYIVDERGLEHFKKNESFYYIFMRKDAVYFSTTLSVPNKKHYMILDNTDSLITGKQIHLKVVLYWEEQEIITG